MAILPAGSCFSFCCWVAFLGVTTLKPEAASMVSLLWTLLVAVLAQLVANIRSARALPVVIRVRICFIFLSSKVVLPSCVDEGKACILFLGDSRAYYTLVVREAALRRAMGTSFVSYRQERMTRGILVCQNAFLESTRIASPAC